VQQNERDEGNDGRNLQEVGESEKSLLKRALKKWFCSNYYAGHKENATLYGEKKNVTTVDS
jgi:hypothetical protein